MMALPLPDMIGKMRASSPNAARIEPPARLDFQTDQLSHFKEK